MRRRWVPLFVSTLLIGGCVTMPNGPGVLVYPSQGKSYELFQGEDQQCRALAKGQLDATPQEGALQSALKSGAVGTAVGVVAGTVIGAALGNPGLGAGLGAGSGLAIGSAGGAQASATTGVSLQQRYDMAYLQCMATKGNIVPGQAVPQSAGR